MFPNDPGLVDKLGIITDSSTSPKGIDSTGVSDRGELIYNAGTGKWRASSGGSINVLDPRYGAKGDGVTDDTVAVQGAVTDANSRSSGSRLVDIILPPGYGFLLSQVKVASNVRLWCYGATIIPNLSGIPAIANSAGMLNGNLADNQTLSNFQIRGGTWQGTGNEAFQQFLFFVGGSGHGRMSQDIVLQDMTVTNWGEMPFYLLNPTRQKILGNTLLNPGLATISGYNAINTYFDGSALTIPLAMSIVRNNIITGSSSAAIAHVITGIAQGANFGAQNILVDGNIVTGGTQTLIFNATNGSTAVTNIQLPNGQAPSSGNNITINGAGFAADTLLTFGAAGAGTLSSPFTGVTGPVTVTGAVRFNAGGIVWEIDAAATATNYICSRNHVNNPGRGGNATALMIGANFGPTPGLAVVSENIVTVAQPGNPMLRLVSTANPADAHVINNRLNGSTVLLLTGSGGAVPASLQRGNRVGTGPSQGRVALVAGTATVSTNEILANDNIMLSRVSPAGTVGELQVGTITPGTSFVINSVQPGTASTIQALDTSTVFWQIIH